MDSETEYVVQETVVDMVRRLATRSTVIDEFLRENEDDNDEVLPYLFLGDISRWYVEAIENRDNDARTYAEAKQVAAMLGEEFSEADDDVEKAISVGFIEMILPDSDDELPDYVEELPQSLQDEVAAILRGRPAVQG